MSYITNQAQPMTGPFYYFKGNIHAPETYLRAVNPDTFERAQLDINAHAGEHRDLWDNYMLKCFPELADEYNADDHKSMPRGRVDCKTVNGKLSFWVTLDKCIKNKEDEIKRRFKLENYDVEFHYGTINYNCKDCK